MRDYGVRRLPVLDEHGYQADIPTLDGLRSHFVPQQHSLAPTIRCERGREAEFRG